MEHKDICNHSCHVTSINKSVCQTLSEMDWERGIWNAAYSGDRERVVQLIQKSRNVVDTVNALDNAGYSALHYAARNGHVEVCQILIKKGASLNVQTKSGKATPLHKAVATGKNSTVKFLIESGAKLDILDDDGKSLLHKAVEYNHMDLVDILIKACPALESIKNNKGLLPSEYN
ncbi:unnamed protein product [Leptosia nina]|uniref:Ankyrin repeat domain-containing protein 39 n=1 Tax=Leptosia nina TaxID=320188 RepID=A0AAV1JN94_9NEOP